MYEGLSADRRLFDFLSAAHRGKVEAVFSSGVYFYIGDQLLMLHDREYGFLPFGIAMEDFSGRAKSFGLEAGMALECVRGMITSPASGFKMQLAYCEASVDVPVFSALSGFAVKAEKLLEDSLRSGLAVYSSCEMSGIDKSSIQDVFAACAHKGLMQLVPAMDAADGEDIESALLSLIGLGRGLTPSMDDFLSGMMFVLHYAKANWAVSAPCIDALQSALEKNVPQRTNVYSAAYLLAAGRGEDFSIMRQCIENAEKESFYSCAEKLMNVGGSSGADMLSGMCFAANYILKHS